MTKAEREIQMTQLRDVSKREKIVFPIVVLGLCIIFLPDACPLIGALTFGNLCKECGVVDRLSDTMQNSLINIAKCSINNTRYYRSCMYQEN